MRKKGIKYSLLLVFMMSTVIGWSQDKISVTPVSFNTSYREYSPVYYKDGLVFSGTNRNNEALTYQDSESGEQLTDLYYIPLSEDSFGKTSLLSKELKSSFHDGPITFSKDGNTAYFTRSQLVNKSMTSATKTSNKLGIYKATFNGKVWTNITPCFFNSPDFNTGQPSLSPDGTRLYFVSDKEDGYGGIDLYYAEIVDSFCGSMVNLGEAINGPSNEMFPFIDGNNKLYYSSNRTAGLGGLDIYVSKLVNSKWNQPYMMDSTVNSAFDDFGIIFNPDETEGFFCSNRLGSDDIYKLEVIYPEFKDCEELINELLCYEFFEESTLNADSVAMIYEWNFGDGNRERSLETYHCYDEPGLYIVELNIMDPLIDKNFVNEATYELEIEAIIQPEVVAPDTISIHTDFNVEVGQGKWKDYQIGNYYIDYGDSTIIKNGKEVHRYSSGGFKELKVLITGYDKLSDKIESNCFYKTIFVNSDSTLLANQNNFLETLKYSGFNTERMEELDDGVYMLEILSSSNSVAKDSTVLKSFVNDVVEIYDTNTNYFSYVIGKSMNPFDLIKDYRLAHSEGFDDAIVKSFQDGRMKIEDLGIVYNDTTGVVNIVLNNIQFEYDGHLLDNTSKLELEKLIEYLSDNEGVSIEVGAHTDASRNVEKEKKLFAAKGQVYSKAAHDKMSGAYNMKLSGKRAKSVVRFLISKGISKDRLKSIGYGETKPLEPNNFQDGTDNPAGRARNRRVEFKILSN